MENVKIAVAGQPKLNFRELNLKQGGNNVRWLNDREERLLQTSLSSLEKEHKRTLNRLQHEVKGLHHTLREQATVRSPQLTKEAHHTDKENSETKRPTMSLHTRTSDLKGESLLSSKTDEGIRSSADEEFEGLDHVSLEDVNNLREKTQKDKETNSSQTKGAWTRKVSSALKRPITKQLSSSSDHSSSSSTSLSVPRRKISVTDPPAMGDLSTSHRLRKTLSQSSLQLNPNTAANHIQSRSSEMIHLSPTHPSGSPPRKLSDESMPRVVSPLFFGRKISQHHPLRNSTSPRPVRKISCPPQIHHLPRVYQEEVIPLQPSRDNSRSTSRSTATMTTELPKLDVWRATEQEPSFDARVSPLGFHVDSMEYNLQEKVNNFLKSLEKNDDIQEKEGKTSD